jgi:lipoprotein-anchoring transpeptidase ErfK/SrfK
MKRRGFLLGLAGLFLPGSQAFANHDDPFFAALFGSDPLPGHRRRKRPPRRTRERKQRETRRAYKGMETVSFRTSEKPGTILIRTRERALYYVLGNGKALKYGVAVGKAGFAWSGTARIGNKVEWPSWTPPEEMIERRPELAEFADGMPGGPDNPLGARALYLYKGKRDTLYRIHGTNEPGSIGTAASSGCIRMLNEEVIDLYERVRIGALVVVG